MKNKLAILIVLFLACIAYADNKPSASATIPDPNGLVNFWLMVENTGTNVADYVDGNDGTMSGNIDWTTGNFSGAAVDCNAGGYVTTSSYSGLSNLSAFTLSFWFKIYSDTDYDSFIVWTIDSTHEVKVATDSAGYNRLTVTVENGGTSNGVSVNNIYTDDTWCHLVIVFDGTQATDAEKLYYYKDGGSKTSFSSYNTLPSTTATGSADLIFGDEVSKVIFDNFSIYNRALTDAEALAIYEHPFAMFEEPSGETHTGSHVIIF